MKNSSRKVRQTPKKATIPAPLYEAQPWPVRVEERLTQLESRTAQLEAWAERFREDAEQKGQP